jgi:hypothetical protein
MLIPGVEAAPATEKVHGAVVEKAPVAVLAPAVIALHAAPEPLPQAVPVVVRIPPVEA